MSLGILTTSLVYSAQMQDIYSLEIGPDWSSERWIVIYLFSTASSSGFGAYVTNFLGAS